MLLCGQTFKRAFMFSLHVLQSCSRNKSAGIFCKEQHCCKATARQLNPISAVDLPPAVRSGNFLLQLSSSHNFKWFINRSNLDMVPKPLHARFHGNVCGFSPWLMHKNKRSQIARSVPSPLLCCCTSELCWQFIAWEISRCYYIIGAPNI